MNNFKIKISEMKNQEKEFSKKIFANNSASGLYDDKQAPPASKPLTPEELNKQENEMLATLSNFEWIMYPFVKTARVLCGRSGRQKAE